MLESGYARVCTDTVSHNWLLVVVTVAAIEGLCDKRPIAAIEWHADDTNVLTVGLIY